MPLILTRKAGEAIRIGDDIVVTVLEIHRSYVRLDIAAPREIRIERDDLPRKRESLPTKRERGRLVLQGEESAETMVMKGRFSGVDLDSEETRQMMRNVDRWRDE